MLLILELGRNGDLHGMLQYYAEMKKIIPAPSYSVYKYEDDVCVCLWCECGGEHGVVFYCERYS